VEALAFAAPLRTHPWAYPALEVVHLIGISMLVGNLICFEFRVWGRASSIPLKALAKLSLSLAAVGFLIAALSGVTMFIAQAQELIGNRIFLIKMLLLFLAGANAALFHSRNSLIKFDGLAKLQTMLSLAIWICVIGLGRAIAYV
jgi:hypothetical protein